MDRGFLGCLDKPAPTLVLAVLVLLGGVGYGFYTMPPAAEDTAVAPTSAPTVETPAVTAP